MAKYRCWDPDYTDTEGAREYNSYDAEGAAHRYAEDVCDDDTECYEAYEKGVDVKVLDSESDVVVTVRVWVAMQPQFRTALRKVEGDEGDR